MLSLILSEVTGMFNAYLGQFVSDFIPLYDG